MCTNADTSFLKSLGWETQFTLEEGLKEAIHEERTTKIFKN